MTKEKLAAVAAIEKRQTLIAGRRIRLGIAEFL